MTSLLGATAAFEVGLSEENIPVSWMFNNTELRPSQSCRMLSEKKTHKLLVQDVDASKQGEYTAVVGPLRSSARLTVEGEYRRRLTDTRLVALSVSLDMNLCPGGHHLTDLLSCDLQPCVSFGP